MLTPLQTATLQSAVLSLASSLIARLLSPNSPPPPLIPILVFTILSTPPNYLFQQLLERQFPGYALKKIDIDEGGKGVTVEEKLNVRNTCLKFLLDQTLGAAVNTALWLGGVQALRGAGLQACLKDVRMVRN